MSPDTLPEGGLCAVTQVPHQIVCLDPGTYVLEDECRVDSSLVSTGGPDVTIIDGPLTFDDEFDPHLLHGVTVTGFVSGPIVGPSYIGNVLLGGVGQKQSSLLDLENLRSAFPEGVVIGNRVQGFVYPQGCYWISDNIVEGGGVRLNLIRCGGAAVRNIVRDAPICIVGGGRGDTLIQNNDVENCEIGIAGGYSVSDSYDIDIVANRVRNSDIGIDFGAANEYSVAVRDNTIIDASSIGIRGLAFHDPDRISVEQNLIAGATASSAGAPAGVGIEIELRDYAECTLAHNTIVGHETGIRLLDQTYGPEPRVSHLLSNLVALNSITGVEASSTEPDPSTLVTMHNDVYGSATNWLGIADPTGVGGNISADPLFVDPDRELFGLRPGSPCIDAGGVSSLQRDIAGSSRTVDGDGDGIASVDIGAYEFVPADPRGPGYWKHQCSDKPFRQVSGPDLQRLFSTVEAMSPAFPECAPVGCGTLIPDGPQNDMRKKAERHALVLWLNLAAHRLTIEAPVDLTDLPSATIVADALAAIEGILCDSDASRAELELAKDLAEALGPTGDDFELAGGRSKVMVAPGEEHQLTLGLINMSDHSGNYDVQGVGPWPIVLSIAQVNGLRGGQVALVPVRISVPRFAAPRDVATMTILAIESASGASMRRSATVTCEVNETTGPRPRQMLPPE